MIVNAGQAAPPFELPRADVPAQCRSLGRLIEDGPVLLVFVKEDCPTCRWVLPLVDRLYRIHSSGGPRVVVVAQEENALPLIRELNLQVPVLLDPSPFEASSAYGIEFVPAFVLVDRDGNIEQVVESFDSEKLESINRRLAEAAGILPQPLQVDGETLPVFRPG